MRTVERFTQGKTGDDSLNEDTNVETPGFIGILDGATSFSGLSIDGVPNGRFASRTVAAAIARLPEDIGAFDAVRQLTAAFAAALNATGAAFDTPEQRPATTLLLYSKAREEIWRIADSPFMVDGVENQQAIPPIQPLVDFRKLVIQSLLAGGASLEDLLKTEPMAETWRRHIPAMQIFVNNDHPFGWGMINGTSVPERFIEIHDVHGAREIVLASDGYPKLFNTLAATEAELQRALATDPLMIGIYPQVKGKKTGWASFDDRTYVRLGR